MTLLAPNAEIMLRAAAGPTCSKVQAELDTSLLLGMALAGAIGLAVKCKARKLAVHQPLKIMDDASGHGQ